MYIDAKIIGWERIYLKDDLVKEALEKGETLDQIIENCYYYMGRSEILYEVTDWVNPREYSKKETIVELFDDEDNVIKTVYGKKD